MVESENSYIAWDFSLVQGKISMVLLFEPQFVSPLYNLKSFDCFACLVLLRSSEFCLIIIGMSRLFSLRSYYSDCLRIHENCVFFLWISSREYHRLSLSVRPITDITLYMQMFFWLESGLSLFSHLVESLYIYAVNL